MSERTRILEVRAKNVKCLREIVIDELGDITEIRGDSGQGKTSILEVIEAGLRGLDPAMVRNGETAAEITLHLSNALVRRVIPVDGKETLRVTDPSTGKSVEKAKEFLRTLCGPQVFRPVEWVRLGGGESKGRTERLRSQRDQLLNSMPLTLKPAEYLRAVKELGDDVAEALHEVSLDGVEWGEHALIVCSALQRACYDYRAIQNARAEDAEAALKHTPKPERRAPGMSIDECKAAYEKAAGEYHRAMGQAESRKATLERRTTLAGQIQKDGAELPTREALNERIEKQRIRRDTFTAEIDQLRAKLRAAEESLDATNIEIGRLNGFRARLDSHEAHQKELAEIDAGLASTSASPEEVEELKRRMEDAIQAGAARRAQDTLDQAVEKAAKARAHSERFDKLVAFFRDTMPKALIERLPMPVEGLSVEGDMITIHGVPLHQLGTSEQIKIGVAIAAKLNPKTGFILVDGAESMGRKDRLALAEAAQAEGLQLILTIVDPDAKPGPGRVVMREGQLVEAAC